MSDLFITNAVLCGGGRCSHLQSPLVIGHINIRGTRVGEARSYLNCTQESDIMTMTMTI